MAIEKASILQVKEWMGHSKIETTMRYLHNRSRDDDAALLAEAFNAGDRDNFVPNFVRTEPFRGHLSATHTA